jgi:hypothetical protein
MNSLGFLCNVDKDDFCIKNIDNPICSTVNAKILNKACAIDMTKRACRNRKNELDESLVEDYCKINSTDELCSCYTEPPDYIPEEIRGTPRCWNKLCNTKGIIPKNMRNEPCNRSIKICSQNLSTSGDSNILSDNVNIVDCRDGGSSSTDSNSATASVAATAPASVASAKAPASDGILGMSYITIFIILLVIIVIVIAIILSRPNTNT